MPISGPASFIPTTAEFLAHWSLVNAALPPASPLVLVGAITRAILDGHATTLTTLHSQVQAEINDVELAQGDLDARKLALHTRLNQFNDKIRAYLAGTTFARAMPKVPGMLESQGFFVPPLDDMDNLWLRINAMAPIPGFTPPLLLLDGYAHATFSANPGGDLALLRAAYKAVPKEELELRVKRGERQDLEDVIYPILKNYREAMPTFFAPNHALVESLPRLTPEPGSTPDAVVASGIWDAAQAKGKLTWEASTAADLDHYDVRWSPGSTYSTDDESTIGTVAKDAVREFLTLQGLGIGGAVAVFRIYVVTDTGNEKGSNTVKITRPV